jgi:hypothetical protein
MDLWLVVEFVENSMNSYNQRQDSPLRFILETKDSGRFGAAESLLHVMQA